MGLVALPTRGVAGGPPGPSSLGAVASTPSSVAAVATEPMDLAVGPFERLADMSVYRPGACNMGPSEIARRRRAGHVGLAATVGTLGLLVAIDAPPAARLLVALPAASAAAGYLQAALHFCAGFGSRGVFNFGPLGETQRIVDRDARARDRSKAVQIGLASLVIGVAAGTGAALLPR